MTALVLSIAAILMSAAGLTLAVWRGWPPPSRPRREREHGRHEQDPFGLLPPERPAESDPYA